MDIIHRLITWCNDNRGALSLIQFIVTIFLGWVSGIFAALRRKPKFKIRVIEGPSLCTTFETGRTYNNYKTHRTAISLYLRIANVGSAPSVIDKIAVAYHNYSFKYTFFWFWIEEQSIILNDFQVSIDNENIKYYPFLTQASALLQSRTDDYLETGKEIRGVVYFEQSECFGSFYPREQKELVKIKIKVVDIFGGCHYKIARIPKVSLSEAQRFNPKFGMTWESLIKTQGEKQGEIDSSKKLSTLNQQNAETTAQNSPADDTSISQRPEVYRKAGILVVETEPINNIDINAFIDELREERIQEQMVW